MELIATIADITTLDTDAIVNAANEALAPGGGVCGAIHRAAGPELARACAAIGGCPTGEARLTPGFRLPARYVIHTAGPVWAGGTRGEAELLAQCYRSALDVALNEQLRSIAFPAISCGIYRYPVDEAATIAVRVVHAFLDAYDLPERVVLVAFDERMCDVLTAKLARHSDAGPA